MPLDRFVLILVCVAGAAVAIVWLAALFGSLLQFPFAGWLAAIPLLLVGYIAWRVVADRLSNPEDDHYDSIEK